MYSNCIEACEERSLWSNHLLNLYNKTKVDLPFLIKITTDISIKDISVQSKFEDFLIIECVIVRCDWGYMIWKDYILSTAFFNNNIFKIVQLFKPLSEWIHSAK